jgi:hypothetical protein
MEINWLDILNTILVFVGTCGTAFLVWKACQKPKARLRFSNGKKELTFSPHYCRNISTKYYVGPQTNSYDASAFERLVEKYNQKLAKENELVLPFRLTNTGKLQLENYRVEIDYDNGINDIGVRANHSLTIQQCIESTNALEGVYLHKAKSQIEYSPLSIIPLNQKDHKDFSVRFYPNPDAEKIELHWRISAKDFFKEGKLLIHLTPRVDELDEIHFKNCERDVPEGGYLIEDLMPYIEKMQKLVYDKQ